MRSSRDPQVTPLAQGAFLLAAGLWPALFPDHFQRVCETNLASGAVRALGAVVAAIGVTVAGGATRAPEKRVWKWLGVGTSTLLAAADAAFLARKHWSWVYAADGAINAALVAGWLGERQRPMRALAR